MKVAVVEKDSDVSRHIHKYIDELIKNDSFFEIDDEKPEIVFYVGGDGTLLRAVQKYIGIIDDIILVGINDSSLGFFYEYEEKDLPDILEKLKNGTLSTEQYPLLKGMIGTQEIFAVNEIRLENPYSTLICDAYINGEHLERFHGTGLLVCSTLGSSGYNKSCNGALVDHKLNVIQLSEIATIQNNAYRSLGSSLILSGDAEITLQGAIGEAVVGYDYTFMPISNVNKIVIQYCKRKNMTIAHEPENNCIRNFKRSFVRWWTLS